MATPTAEDIKNAQAQTVAVAKKLKEDAAFKAAYQADPLATLKAEGMSDQAANALLAKVAKETGTGDVSGFEYEYVDIYFPTYWERKWYHNGVYVGYQLFTY